VWSRPPEGLHGVSEVQSRTVVRRRGGGAYVCVGRRPVLLNPGGEGGDRYCIDKCPEDPRIKRPTKGFENRDIEYRDINIRKSDLFSGMKFFCCNEFNIFRNEF